MTSILVLLFLFLFISSAVLVMMYTSQSKFKLWVDVNLFGSAGVWQAPVKNKNEKRIINVSACRQKYGDTIDPNNYSLGGDTPEKARENGYMSACRSALQITKDCEPNCAEPVYVGFVRDTCGSRALEKELVMNLGGAKNATSYIEGMKDACSTLI